MTIFAIPALLLGMFARAPSTNPVALLNSMGTPTRITHGKVIRLAHFSEFLFAGDRLDVPATGRASIMILSSRARWRLSSPSKVVITATAPRVSNGALAIRGAKAPGHGPGQNHPGLGDLTDRWRGANLGLQPNGGVQHFEALRWSPVENAANYVLAVDFLDGTDPVKVNLEAKVTRYQLAKLIPGAWASVTVMAVTTDGTPLAIEKNWIRPMLPDEVDELEKAEAYVAKTNDPSDMFVLAEAYNDVGLWAKALNCYQSLSQRVPNDAGVKTRVKELHQILGRQAKPIGVDEVIAAAIRADKAGDLTSAERILKEWLRVHVSPGDGYSAAKARTTLAGILQAEKKVGEVIGTLTAGVEPLRAWIGNQRSVESKAKGYLALGNLQGIIGDLYQNQQDEDRCRAAYGDSIKSYQAGERQNGTSNHFILAQLAYRRALTLGTLGRVREGLDAYRQAESEARQSPEPEAKHLFAEVSRLYATGLHTDGQFDAAEKEYLVCIRALDEVNRHEASLDMVANRGLVLKDLGRYAEAEPVLSLIAGMRSKTDHDFERQRGARLNLGTLLEVTGRLEEAIIEYDKLLGDFGGRALTSDDYYLMATIRNNIGLIQITLGNPTEAVKDIELALKNFRDADRQADPLYASTQASLAEAQLSDGKISEASQTIRIALEQLHQLWPGDHPDIASALQTRARVKSAANDFAGAVADWREVCSIDAKTKPNYNAEIGANLSFLSAAELRAGDFASADHHFSDATRTFTAASRRFAQASGDNGLLAFTSMRADQLDQAIRIADERFRSVPKRDARSDYDRLLALRGQGTNLTLDLQIARRTLAGSPALERRRLEYKACQETVAEFIGQPHPELTEEGIAAKRKELFSNLDQLERKFNQALFAAHPELQSKDFTSAQVQRALKPNAGLIEFVAYSGSDGKGRYAAFVTRPTGSVQFVEIGMRSEIDPLVTDLMHDLLMQSSWRSDGQKLFAKLLAPFHTAFARTYIIADAALTALPFEALMADAKKTLLESTEVVYLNHARDLTESTPAKPSQVRGAAFAGPTYGKPAKYDWTALSGALTEGAEVSHLTGGILYSEKKATRERLLAVKRPGFLHIATHGRFVPVGSSLPGVPRFSDYMLRAQLALADANSGRGVVTALDLGALDLRGTSLVVLSGCQTANGEITHGEGLFGFPRALRYAGARSVVMSLTVVNDAATQRMMTSFYGELARGATVGAALRKAKLAELHRSGAGAAWAMFVLFGNPDAKLRA